MHPLDPFVFAIDAAFDAVDDDFGIDDEDPTTLSEHLSAANEPACRSEMCAATR